MERIPIEELEDRRVYLLRSRNLLVGAWNADTEGFVGIREKFAHEFLFTEYERDTSSVIGTAIAVVATDVVVPAEVPLVEYLRDEDGELVKDERGYAVHNQPLFDLLKPIHDSEISLR